MICFVKTSLKLLNICHLFIYVFANFGKTASLFAKSILHIPFAVVGCWILSQHALGERQGALWQICDRTQQSYTKNQLNLHVAGNSVETHENMRNVGVWLFLFIYYFLFVVYLWQFSFCLHCRLLLLSVSYVSHLFGLFCVFLFNWVSEICLLLMFLFIIFAWTKEDKRALCGS